MDESWRVTITISRSPPGFHEHLKRDRAWSSTAFTNAELAALLSGMFKKPGSEQDELLALIKSHLVRQTGWKYEKAMLRQFAKGRGWLTEKERRGE